MPTKFFNIRARDLKHHTLSLTPDVEKIVTAAMAYWTEEITTVAPKDRINFSVAVNVFILTRVAQAIVDHRQGRKPSLEEVKFVLDLIEGNHKITQTDLEDYRAYSQHFRRSLAKRRKHDGRHNRP